MTRSVESVIEFDRLQSMLSFIELQLGNGWSADPNVPEPQVSVAGSSVNIRFRCCRIGQDDNTRRPSIFGGLRLFSKGDPKFDETWANLCFIGCTRWRWDSTNDHEWYKKDGHGRYSNIAPSWGKFYELVGEDPIRDAVPWDTIGADAKAARHFLCYFRDETLEFMADEWLFNPEGIV